MRVSKSQENILTDIVVLLINSSLDMVHLSIARNTCIHRFLNIHARFYLKHSIVVK